MFWLQGQTDPPTPKIFIPREVLSNMTASVNVSSFDAANDFTYRKLVEPSFCRLGNLIVPLSYRILAREPGKIDRLAFQAKRAKISELNKMKREEVFRLQSHQAICVKMSK